MNEPIERIVNGVLTYEHEYPFAVYLRIQLGFFRHAVCGGTLISPQHVVTAGHCMEDTLIPGQVQVRYGSSRTQSQRTAYASRIKVHPKFNSQTLENDIAIITLSRPLVFDSTVSSIPVYFGNLKQGHNVTAMGWGRTSNLPGASVVSRMRKVDLSVGNATECNKVDPMFITNDGPFVCTSTLPGDRDSCSGDSGAPVVVELVGDEPQVFGEWKRGGNGLLLVGFTSYGDNLKHDYYPPCGDPTGFGYSTHVAYFADFVMRETGLSKSDLQGTKKAVRMERVANSTDTSSAVRGFESNALLAILCMFLIFRFIHH